MQSRYAAVVLYGMIILACMAGTAGAGTDRQLLGTWQLTASVVDDQGNFCPFIPQQMEFTSQGMVIMAGMPVGPIPYRADLTRDELGAVYARLPELKGAKIIVMRPSPQIEWVNSPMVYGYTVQKDELGLILAGWPKAVFRRMK